MVEYIYARENISRLLIILAIVTGIFIPLLMLPLINKDLWSEGYFMIQTIFIATFIITLIIILVFLLKALKWRKWHRNMKENGKRVPGTVIDYGYKSYPGHVRNETPPSESYWLFVQYQDLNGLSKTFETPYLSFPPKEILGLRCNVYLLEDQKLATDIDGLIRL